MLRVWIFMNRSQLFRHGVAEAVVRSEPSNLLLLRQRERSVPVTFVSEALRLNANIFLFIIPSPDKQQKGEFSIEGYGVKMNSGLRKDSKKDFCFEISAPDKRSYMVRSSLMRFKLKR